MTQAAAAIELGGTKVLVTIGSEPAQYAPPVRIPTTNPEATIAATISALEGFIKQGLRFHSIGIASFGPIGLDSLREDYGRILATPKSGWSNTDIIGPLRERFEVPVVWDTDVNGTAFGEGLWGASRECRQHVYVTVGTGVGVGICVNGRPLHGLTHPEAGHLQVRRDVVADTFAAICRWHGDCVEGLVSGPALKARLGRTADGAPADHPVWNLVGEYRLIGAHAR